MKLVTFKKEQKQIIGLMDKTASHVADINTLGLSKNFADMNDLIENATESDMENMRSLAGMDAFARGDIYAFADIELLAPIPRPKHDIICLGLNYSEHIAETGAVAPEAPVYFGKRASKTSGHGMTINGHLDVDPSLDYEVELAVVIGRECSAINEADAEAYIFGYMVLNDFSTRVLQRGRKQWFLGKGVDTFASMGPWIVTKDELPFPLELDLCSRVNGEVRQKSNTKNYINPIAPVMAELSRTIALEPGDIISTGTPSGVGAGFDPPKYLKKGDIVECEVQGVGKLKNIVG